jgi:ADP-ribose pyrophosphatase YjhB (NUDIX family)
MQVSGSHPFTQADFDAIYSLVPRLTVEVVLRGPRGVFLTRRSAGPCRGLWHIPGGTVRFAEPLADAVARVAFAETGVTVTGTRPLGPIEYPSHYLNGLGCPVGFAFAAEWEGEPEALGGCEGGWFDELPPRMHDEQAAFLRRNPAVLAPETVAREYG